VGRSKAGVGKSRVAIATLNALWDLGQEESWGDAMNCLEDVLGCRPTELAELDGADGWVQLINLCEEQKDHRGGEYRRAE
jgi:hypothetical protein